MAQENTARVITIAATERPQDIRLRVAAYARVSSSSDEQLNSFAAQNRYYTELISSKGNWQLVDIYADEGITGTSIEKRDDFKRMLRDCERGLIDRIKKIIFNNAVDNITRITSAPQSVSAELLYDIIVSDAIADSYKVDLIVADIPHADQTEISRYLSALRLDEFVKIFDSRSRPKFENTSDNVAILNAFKARGWIYDYILDEAGYFKIRRHAPRLVSKTN